MKVLYLPLCAAVTLCAWSAEIGVVEEIVAKVNGDIITRTELDRSRKQLEADLKQRGVTGPEFAKEFAAREKDILREKVDQLLLVQKARDLSINVDPEVSKHLAEIQTQSKISDPDKFQQYVREQTGQTFEDYKAEMRNGLMTQRVVRQEVGRSINIPRPELEKYYNEHKSEFMREDRVFLREITIAADAKDAAAVAAAEKKAKDLSARAKKGEKFGELARDNSNSPTAKQFGELGAFQRNELDKKIADIVFAQERGFVTDPIRLENGFIIIKVEERHKAGQAAFEEVENEIMERLYMPKFQPEIRNYLTALRQEAFLEIKPGYVDSAPAPGKNTAWSDPAQLRPETVTKEEVAAQTRRRRLLWAIPIPGTSTSEKEKAGSSKSQ